MKTWKWRIALPIANVLLAIGMSPWFYNGLLANSPNLYFAVQCLDVVPTVVSDRSATFQISHQMLYWTRGYWVRSLFWEHQVMVFLFWCWVGWKIDLASASLDCGRVCTIVEGVVGFVLSPLPYLHSRTYRMYPYPNALRWVLIGWSVALFCYSLVRLSRVLATRRRLP